MEAIVVKVFTVLWKAIAILTFTGLFTGVLLDIQKLAFEHKRRGLVSLSAVNEQLVGKTPWLKEGEKKRPLRAR
jgi:hypothetical protein